MRVCTNKIITNGDMSADVSATQQLNQAFGYSVQAVWTGSPVGTIKLQASIDNVTYIDVANSSQAVSGAGDYFWNVFLVEYPWMKAVYTFSSGTGTLNVQLFYRSV